MATLNNTLCVNAEEESKKWMECLIEATNKPGHFSLSNPSSPTKRVYKKNFCPFCKKAYIKLTRHITTMHKNEKGVAAALAGGDTKAHMGNLLQEGNSLHNFAVLHGDEEEIVPKKKSRFRSTELVPCSFCKQFYSAKCVKLHMDKCPKGTGQQSSLQKCRQLKLTSDDICPELATLLSTMHMDEIFNIIKKDAVILMFGNSLAKKHAASTHQRHNIFSRLRELGKLVKGLRVNAKIEALGKALEPIHYEKIVQEALVLGEWDPETQTFGKPQLPKNIGHSLNKCAELMKLSLIKNGKDYKLLDEFRYVMSQEWNVDILSKSLRTMANHHYNKEEKLPSIDDIKRLSKYLLAEQKKLKSQLERNMDSTTYRTLMELVLVFLIQFNRRRPGEIARLTLNAYKAASQLKSSNDAKSLYVQLPGKNNRKLGVIVPQHQKHLIDFLIAGRDDAAIMKSNKYVFANARTNPISAVQAFAKHANKCGTKNPSLLRATLLRKQFATHAAHDLNMQDKEVEDLAEFMGHTKEIHKKHYRLSGRDLHLKKIEPVLQAMQAS